MHTKMPLSEKDYAEHVRLCGEARRQGYFLRRDGSPERPFVIHRQRVEICTFTCLADVADWLTS